MTADARSPWPDLVERGLVHDHTDAGALDARLAAGPVTLYYGCDPTADSLHLGNLIGLLVLRRFADAGHRPIALVGGATGMIGDPGGRSEERNLLDEATLAANVAAIRAQVERIVGDLAVVVDNRTWTEGVGVLEFLRDVGKHATVNQMIAKESVRARVESEHGISFTEFSYMLLQAFDYWHLHVAHGCELQIGGADQWGNITAGIDLVRRREGTTVHGFTWPLMTRADGAKFGKSTGGAVWLGAHRTTPYQLFQYLLNTDDRDVGRFLGALTLLDLDTVAEIVTDHQADPAARRGQRRLARETVTLVHGAEAADSAEGAAAILFGRGVDDAGPGAWEAVADEVGRIGPDGPLDDGLDAVALAARAFGESNSAIRRLMADGAVRVGDRALGPDDVVTPSDLHFGRYALLRRGKKHHVVLDAEKPARQVDDAGGHR